MYQSIEDLDVFKQIENIEDAIWAEVVGWNTLSIDTIGKQLIRSSDSVGANMVESDGRYHYKDILNFLYISRGSLKESRFWLRRAVKRKIITEERYKYFTDELTSVLKQLNSLITTRRNRLTAKE
jgi:four helix bundle protein